MKRVLQILSSLNDGGGVQTMLKNYYAHMDRSQLHTDFVVCGDQIGGMEAWFAQLGAHVYHIPPRKENPLGNLNGLRRIIKNGHYDVIHCHQDYHGAIAIAMAKRYGVPRRIIHGHQAYPQENAVKKIRRKCSVRSLLKNATDFVACGELAGEWLYGKQMMETGRVKILHNAIPTTTYVYSEENRHRLRGVLGISQDTLVVGHIGRFSKPKNHTLMIHIFAEFYQKHPNAVLLLVGDGELRAETEQLVAQLGLENCVQFLGVRRDVPALLSAMDVFLLPSRWEGLGIVVVESQVNGVPVVCSAQVPREVKLADNVLFIPEEHYEDSDSWCDMLEQALTIGRGDYEAEVIEAGYDICREAKKLEQLYLGD